MRRKNHDKRCRKTKKRGQKARHSREEHDRQRDGLKEKGDIAPSTERVQKHTGLRPSISLKAKSAPMEGEEAEEAREEHRRLPPTDCGETHFGQPENRGGG